MGVLYSGGKSPEPVIARKVLGRICVENDLLQYTISDPLNYEQPVKLPYK